MATGKDQKEDIAEPHTEHPKQLIITESVSSLFKVFFRLAQMMLSCAHLRLGFLHVGIAVCRCSLAA